MKYYYVAIGAIIGSMCRYGLSLVLPVTLFPLHTFTINCIGSFLLGMVTFHPTLDVKWRFMIGVGCLGSFTTFSTFTLDFIQLFEQGHMGLAAIYIGVTVVVSITGAYFGMRLVKGRERAI